MSLWIVWGVALYFRRIWQILQQNKLMKLFVLPEMLLGGEAGLQSYLEYIWISDSHICPRVLLTDVVNCYRKLLLWLTARLLTQRECNRLKMASKE